MIRFSTGLVQAVVFFAISRKSTIAGGEQPRLVGSSKHVVGVNDVSINVMELLGMVLRGWLLIVEELLHVDCMDHLGKLATFKQLGSIGMVGWRETCLEASVCLRILLLGCKMRGG